MNKKEEDKQEKNEEKNEEEDGQVQAGADGEKMK